MSQVSTFLFLLCLILFQNILICKSLNKNVEENVKNPELIQKPTGHHTATCIANNAASHSHGSSHSHRKLSKTSWENRRKNRYRVLVMGDTGEFDVFTDNKDKRLFNPENQVGTMREICERFNKKHKGKLAQGFLQVYNKIRTLSHISEGVILGDIVYPEVKYLGVNSKWNGFKDHVVNGKYREMVNEYVYRLNCGWYYFVKLFKNNNNPTYMRDAMRMVFGNHSYDVNYKTEAFFMTSFFPTKQATLATSSGTTRVTKYVNEREVLLPKLTYSNSNKQRIQYLDIDPTMLSCSQFLFYKKNGKYSHYRSPKEFRNSPNFKKLGDCMKNLRMFGIRGLEFLTTRRINAYLRYFRHLTTLLRNMDYNADWRIARMHQPIFNPEHDFDGMKQNEWLMKLFKKAHIHLWFVAHSHSAQIHVGMYENKNYKYANLNYVPGKGPRTGEATDLRKVVDKCTDDDNYYGKNFKIKSKIPFTCVNRAKVWLRRSQAHKKGKNTQKFSQFGKLTINRNNEEFILQTLVGNSGKKFMDPVFSDKFGDFGTIFGFSNTNAQGYAIADFYNSKKNGARVFKIKYYIKREKERKFKKHFTLKVYQSDKLDSLSRSKLLKKNFKIDFLKKVLKNKYNSKKATPAAKPTAKPAAKPVAKPATK